MTESIPGRFEAQVAANRDRLAVRAAGEGVSYGALNEAANRVARSVLATAPDTDAVAVLIGQGVSVITTMLGVMKAGKIFVPLDTRQPAARMLQILDDCEARLLLTNEANLPHANALLRPGLQVVNVEAPNVTLSSGDLGLSIGGDAVACLMYTSGSTGSPKGVVQTHCNMLNRIEAFTDVFQVSPHDRLTMLAACSIAQGLTSALLALLNGACLYPFDLPELGVGELAPWLVAHSITVFISTTSTFRHFAKTLTTGDEFPALRAIRLGSEQILRHDVELYRQHFPRGCMLVGTLGSTESGPVANYFMDHDSTIADDVVPAGYPQEGVTLRFLDDAGGDCPVGEPGEIAVQSRFLSHGYWRDPDRTAAAFVDMPGATGERLYRTGDLGRMRTDGCLEFLGRKNLRVKIRGFRVELEEVERSLCTHPLVLEAAAMARPDATGGSRLVAYVVSREGPRPTANDLCAHLRNTLPEHMVPATFEFLQALPLTASGKVNRHALPPPRETVPDVSGVDRRPSDVVEVWLTTLWEDLLERRPIDVTANFFALGGDSLLAARLSAAVEQTFGTKLPLTTFLRAATIEQQAQLLRERRMQVQWPSLVPIRVTGSKPPLFCVHLADGHVLSYRDLARHLPPDQPLYGVQSRGLDRSSRINTRIEEMARDYIAEIQKFHPRGPYAICGWSYGGVVAFEMARQLEQAGRAVALLALFDSRARGPSHVGAARSPSSFRSLSSRVPSHMKTLLKKGNRLSYVSQRIRTAKNLIEMPLWRMVVLWYRRGGWLPRVLQNVFQTNRNARRDYVPKAYGGHVSLFRVTQPGRSDPLLGWESLAAGGLEIHDVPGTHVNMVFEPHVRSLVEKLAHCLDKAWAGAESAGHSAGTVGGDDRAA